MQMGLLQEAKDYEIKSTGMDYSTNAKPGMSKGAT